MFNFRHSRRISYAPGQMDLLKYKTNILEPILIYTPKKWYIQVHCFAYADIIEPLSHLHIPPYEFKFHTQPRILLTFRLNVFRILFRKKTAQYCSELTRHSHYQSNHLDPLFNSIMMKSICTWFLDTETTRLQIFSKVYQNAPKKRTNSFAYTMQSSPNLSKPLPLNLFLFYRSFKVVEFSGKLEPLRNGPFKILHKPTEVTYELLTQAGKTFTHIEVI